MSEPTPDAPTAPRLIVKVTCGTDDRERANQGFTVAATAVAAGAMVSLWLAGDATWLAVAGAEPDLGLEHAAPTGELLAAVLESGRVSVCTQCAARRGLTQKDLRDGVLIAGAASFVEEVLTPGVHALVY